MLIIIAEIAEKTRVLSRSHRKYVHGIRILDYDCSAPITHQLSPAARRDLHDDHKALRFGRCAMTHEQLELIAHHEAAHAVMMWWCHRPFKWVMIAAGGEPRGQVEAVAKDTVVLPFNEGLVEFATDALVALNHMVIPLAGAIAVARIEGSDPDWELHKMDWLDARHIARVLCRTSDEAEAFLKWQELRTRSLISQPEIWEQVTAVAQALLEREPVECDGQKQQRLSWDEVGSIVSGEAKGACPS